MADRSEATDIEDIKQNLRELNAEMRQMQEVQNEILRDLNRYKGIWGGVIMVVTAVWALFVTFKDAFKGGSNGS